MQRYITTIILLIAVNLWAGEIVQTVNFSPNDLMFSKVQEYDVVELRGCVALAGQPGEPRLPKIRQSVLIPAGAVPVSVEIISVDEMELKGTYKIFPYQSDVPLPMPGRAYIPQFVEPSTEIYNSSEPYPIKRCILTGSGTLSGYRLAHIEINPVQYIPAEGKIRFATRVTYKLRYLENQVENTVPTIDQQKIFGENIRAIVSNPEMVEVFAPRVSGKSVSRLLPPGDYKYVIISGATNLDSIFQRLADWKTKKGVPAKVVQISWINSNYSGWDLPEKVRNFIIDARNTWGTVWVLLGGSADHKTSGQNLVPERSAWYINAPVGYYPDEDTIPCDLYFAGLNGTWDFNGNHIYGQIADSADMYSDVYVGRASVYNIAQAQNFVSKILTYEKNPPTNYLRKMLLPTGILWSSYEERPMQDSIARMTPTPPWVDGKLYERNGTLSRQIMIDSMNVGYGMGAWEGHGDENGIYYNGGSSPYLTSTDADGLTNGTKQGIAISIACFTGAWDETPNGDCFAEHLANRVGGGLIGVMFNSRYGWGAYVGGYVPGPSERLDTTYYAKIFEAGFYKMGQVLAVDKDCWVPYADSGNQYDYTRWCLYELNLIGDPELPLWTNIPANLTVTYPAVIQIGNQNVTVTVTGGGSPVNNALVCLQKGTETYAYGYTNASGQVTLNVAPTTPGTMDITVTAKNYYPFEGTIQVQTSTYAYVMYLKSSISDPAPGGNNDGILNPGESVEIPLWVKNYGSVQANGVTGRLREADPYITISDTIKTFGNIGPNDSAYTGANGYNLQVANNCPNGYGFNLTLVCKDNVDSTWTSQFGLMVYAPVLTYQSVSVVGGNG
ncbi:MAG: C25 family cysteine peptidase, partial [bacterium]